MTQLVVADDFRRILSYDEWTEYHRIKELKKLEKDYKENGYSKFGDFSYEDCFKLETLKYATLTDQKKKEIECNLRKVMRGDLNKDGLLYSKEKIDFNYAFTKYFALCTSWKATKECVDLIIKYTSKSLEILFYNMDNIFNQFLCTNATNSQKENYNITNTPEVLTCENNFEYCNMYNEIIAIELCTFDKSSCHYEVMV